MHDLDFTRMRADGVRGGVRDVDVTLRRGDRVTLRDNVTFGATRPQEAIDRAAYLSVLDAVAASLPQQWDMPLSERGVNLSGRQRLALARGLSRPSTARCFCSTSPRARSSTSTASS